MIYLTQLIFIKKGKESTFLQFESFAIPLMEEYNGRILYRLRPQEKNFITATGELPYEIHFISFDSEADLKRFMRDERRLEFLHLKEESIKSTILVKGKKL